MILSFPIPKVGESLYDESMCITQIVKSGYCSDIVKVSAIYYTLISSDVFYPLSKVREKPYDKFDVFAQSSVLDIAIKFRLCTLKYTLEYGLISPFSSLPKKIGKIFYDESLFLVL